MTKRPQVATVSDASGAAVQAAPVPIPVLTEVEEQIRTRAYQFYEERGREPGHEVEDWLRAEAEIYGANPRLAA